MIDKALDMIAADNCGDFPPVLIWYSNLNLGDNLSLRESRDNVARGSAGLSTEIKISRIDLKLLGHDDSEMSGDGLKLFFD